MKYTATIVSVTSRDTHRIKSKYVHRLMMYAAKYALVADSVIECFVYDESGNFVQSCIFPS